MKAFSLLFIILITAISAAGTTQGKEDPPQGTVITIGTVDKIDEKAKSIKLILATSATIEAPAGPGDSRGGTQAGASGRRGGRGGGGHGGNAPSGNTNDSQRPSKPNLSLRDYKILVSPKTLLREGDKEIKFTDIKVGDILQVTSTKPGSTLDAIEISRTPRASTPSS